jgi:hypothetical protein
MKVLSSGIDTLELGFNIESYNIDFGILSTAKQVAQSTTFDNDFTDKVVDLNGLLFTVQRTGVRGYEYILINDDMTIRLTPKAQGGKYFPEMMISFRSAFLWRLGWRHQADVIIDWVNGFAVVKKVSVSRADLCIDVDSSLPDIMPHYENVVTMSRYKEDYACCLDASRYSKGLHMTGYTFGRGIMQCRIYDKAYEITKTHKDWFKEIWNKSGWQEDEPVTRVEFQLRRDKLKFRQVDTFEDLKLCIADLWRYCTVQWLRISDKAKGIDKGRRWRASAFWNKVTTAVRMFGEMTGVTRIAQMKPRYDALRKQARGFLVSIAAMSAATAKYNTIDAINEMLDYIKKQCKDDTFLWDVFKRKARYLSIETPTLLTGGLRSHFALG